MSAIQCPSCGAAVDVDSRFCGACGYVLQPAAKPQPAPTIMGLTPEAAEAVARAKEALAAKKPVTTDGPATVKTGLPEAIAPTLPSMTAATAGAAPPGRDETRTIMGLPTPLEGTGAPGGPVEPPAPGTGPARTMLGVQIDVQQLEEAARSRTVPTGATPATPTAPPEPRGPAADGRPRAMVAGISGPRPSDAPRDSMSSSSVSSSSISSSSLSSSSLDSSGDFRTSTTSWVMRRRGAPTGLVVALLVLGVVTLVAAVVVGWIVLGRTDDGGRLEVVVARSPAGDKALLDVTLAPFTPGAEVELLGQRQRMDAGRARFEIPMQSLAVGTNELPVTIRSPQAESVEKVRVVLRYRVRADLAGLSSPSPSYALLFEVVPGARVEIDGQPVAADPSGRMVHVVPLASALAQGPTHTVSFRVISADAVPEEGSIATVLPVSSLVVDRPAEGAVVELDSIECAGGVDAGATVTINGQVVVLAGDRFLHRVALPEHKDYTIEIVAAAPGKAPTTIRRAVRRVVSLAAVVQAFAQTVDRDLTYARVSENPAIYRGRKARFTGKVFNARTERGATTLQILLHSRDCPEGLRCSLWVEYHGETSAVIGDWVDVLGELAGEQSYQTTRGERLTVPKLDARFVVERAPPG